MRNIVVSFIRNGRMEHIYGRKMQLPDETPGGKGI